MVQGRQIVSAGLPFRDLRPPPGVEKDWDPRRYGASESGRNSEYGRSCIQRM